MAGCILGANKPDKPAVKHKHIVLMLKEKLEIIGMLDAALLMVIAESMDWGRVPYQISRRIV